MVGGVAGAGAVVQVPGLVRVDRLGIADELDRLVGDVFGEVIAIFRAVGLLDGVVVVDQVGVVLVGLPPRNP
jgi:hypothetical protein